LYSAPLEQNLDLHFLEVLSSSSEYFGGGKNFFPLLGAELQFLGHPASSIFTRLTNAALAFLIFGTGIKYLV
jgi:hypothetical protein